MSSYSRFRPIDSSSPGLNRYAAEDQDNRINILIGEGCPIISSEDVLAEEKKISNTARFVPGNHAGLLLEKPHTFIDGVAGVRVERLGLFRDDAIVSNMHFVNTGTGGNSSQLAVVKPGARVVFRDCIFERLYNDPNAVDAGAPPVVRDCFVLIEPGGKALFTGCVFRSNLESGAMNGTGTVVQNLNAAAGGVIVSNGANFTTHSHGITVTAGSEIT